VKYPVQTRHKAGQTERPRLPLTLSDTTMTSYLKKLNALEIACRKNFEDDSDDPRVDDEYVQIRVNVLHLLHNASQELEADDRQAFRRKVIAFFCSNMGCHLDMDVLESDSASVLSESEIDFIVKNSALSRWQ